MKKVILSLSVLILASGASFAQKKSKKDATNDKQAKVSTLAPTATPDVAAAAASSMKAEDMAFQELVHDFGTVPEGPDATTEFSFKNTGKEPIIIQKAQASCGCTVPSYSSQPVPPGATGTINVAFHTKGKPTAFNKSVTVVSNAGTRILTIKGNVEKAPTGSVPENSSMIKTN